MDLPINIGPIKPGAEIAAKWDFTTAKWRDVSYLWRIGNKVYLSLLYATRMDQGALRSLIEHIEADGLQVAVPHPVLDMPDRLRKLGFEPMDEDGHEVWLKRLEA